VFTNTWSKELSDVASGYIKKANIKNMQPLFPITSGTNKGQPQTQSNFSKAVKAAFRVHYKKHEITEQNIRDIYVSSNIKGKNISMKVRKSIAYLMGHTVKKQDDYIKITTQESDANVDSEETCTACQDAATDPIEVDDGDSMPPLEPIDDEEVEVVEKATKEEVYATMKKYYELKIEYMQRKLAMLDKMI
jgi:hypothetical protein